MRVEPRPRVPAPTPVKPLTARRLRKEPPIGIGRSGVPAKAPLDLHWYAKTHAAFPNESMFDQFLDDNQWESYRVLGDLAGRAVLAERS